MYEVSTGSLEQLQKIFPYEFGPDYQFNNENLVR